MSRTIDIGLGGREHAYSIDVGDGVLSGCGKWAKKCLKNNSSKIVIVSNTTVYKLYGDAVATAFANSGFTVSHWLLKDGEQHKSLANVEKLIAFLSSSGMTRTDAVVALGGGVVGDLAGFAAAIYLRGIAFLQIPTTLLSMIDSSVGGKTGVNSTFGKNLIGAFHQPNGVLVDVATLSTLPPREITAGLCEMVKHAAISGRPLLKQTSAFLSSNQKPQNLIDLIAANVEFKAKIVAGDERESSKNMSSRSRKILNFGHTLAHALEKVTDYRYFKHGEAVGYGILFAAELSKSLALCDEKDVKLLNDVVQSVGSLPPLGNIDGNEVFEAFKFDKKHLSGSLQMILLKGIGKPVIVTDEHIPRATAQKVLKKLLQKWS